MDKNALLVWAFANRSRQFITLQTLGWSGYAFIVYVTVVAPYFSLEMIVIQLKTLAIETFSGVFFTLVLRFIFHTLWYQQLSIRVLVSFIAVVTTSSLWTIIKYLAYRYMRDFDLFPITWIQFGGWFLFSFASLLAWTTLYYGIHYYFELQKEHKKTLNAQAMAKDAQLKMLRYQLNPHFTFNAMNAISTLILKNENNKANAMLDRLCSLLRFSLDSDPTHKITVEQEFSILEQYLSIEKIRLCDRLHLEIELDRSIKHILIPSLLVQPLVENAIKHAIAPNPKGGSIYISARKKSQNLEISVQDTGPGLANTDQQSYFTGNQSGVGLLNTKERLAALYGDQYEIKLNNIEPSGLTVTVNIPLQTTDSKSPC